MKLYIVALFSLVASVGANNVKTCYEALDDSCSREAKFEEVACNAIYGGYQNSDELQKYVGQHLDASFHYLKLATFFNSYQRDRPGFAKLFRSLSDRSFDDSVKLIKQITKRGGRLDIATQVADISNTNELAGVWEVDEVIALGKVLQTEKDLATKAIDIHLQFSGLYKKNEISRSHYYDPEMTQFVEEEFLTKQAETIRKLSGCASDLWKILKEDGSRALGTYCSIYRSSKHSWERAG